MSRKPVSEGGTPQLPVIEKPDYQEMYKFYESLGDKRTLQKVATQFNKSKSFIQLLSRSFGWKHRIQAVESRPMDPVVKDTQAQVDDVRRKLVAVVQEISDTLYELMFVAKAVKIGQADMAPLEARSKQLYQSLTMWGFTWKTPGQFRQLIQTLKEISDFNVSGNGKGAPRVGNATQVNVEKMELRITDD